MIAVEGLCKKYRGGRGLDGFSLRLERGEVVGLVGPNGAGKTTLIKILATLVRADAGKASVDGHDVAMQPAKVRAALGYLPDIAGVYQDMEIGEFLAFFADAFRLKEPKRNAAIEKAIERCGLGDRRDEFVEHLSLGWKQRLLLAKTLLHEPKLLLLDEPATGLDPLARIALREQLKQLRAEGITILVSSHILSDLEDICTRIAFIADGKNVSEPAVESAGAANASAANLRCEVEFQGAMEIAERVVGSVAGSKIFERKNGFLAIEIPGDAKEASQLLSDLLAAGLTIVHFDARGPGLEERYRRAFREHKS